ncbi:MAG: protoheme IX farnesyltransferase [Rhodobacteraceae bacterium]|nr:protoheme IX farnesyltransferase [Paracoccaceae bacterium]
MSLNDAVQSAGTLGAQNNWRSYLALCKPKVVLLIAFTAAVGMLLASPGLPDIGLFAMALLGISLAAASGAAINHWVDRRIDEKMARTHKRPLPQGEISPAHALAFALLLGGAGLGLLAIEINLLTTGLTALSLIGYAVIYTVFLKHMTPYNIVWGGAAGAAPPLLGWIAVTGTLDPGAIILFAIIFLWTPPHFWALAIRRREDYARAGVPMLPVTHGVAFTKRQTLGYTIALAFTTTLPFAIGMSGLFYLVAALVLGAVFLHHAVGLLRTDDDARAMAMFKFSVQYLMFLFAALLADHFLNQGYQSVVRFAGIANGA